MARIYTRGGDRGETSLGDGSRTAKSSPRVDLYGEVDELISQLGCCAVILGQDAESGGDGNALSCSLRQDLIGIQNRLFSMASFLAGARVSGRESGHGTGNPAFVCDHLEKLIDALEADLSPLKNFILPGGTPAAAALQLARSVCRRVERKAVALAAAEPVPDAALAYLNRLSDFLFTASRAVNHAAGVPDQQWRQDEGAAD